MDVEGEITKMATKNKAMIISITGVALIGGYIGYSAYHSTKESGEAQKITDKVKAVMQQQDKEKALNANKASDVNGVIQKTVTNYFNDSETIDWQKDSINMGYEYMTDDLKNDIQSKIGDKMNKGFENIKKFKRKVIIEKMEFKSIKLNDAKIESDKIATVNAVLTRLTSEDDKPKMRTVDEFTITLVKNNKNMWAMNSLDYKQISKELIK